MRLMSDLPLAVGAQEVEYSTIWALTIDAGANAGYRKRSGSKQRRIVGCDGRATHGQRKFLLIAISGCRKFGRGL